MVCKPHICLFGGSFDPVHCGHLHIAAAARQACALDRVIFLPAACSPFKVGQQTMFSDSERLNMLRLATQDYDWAEVSDLDLTLPPPSWSWRLAEHFHNTEPEAELYWLMGTDQWQALHLWARYDYLTELLHFIVYHRGEAPTPREGVRSSFIRGHHPASSTGIREALKNGQPLPLGWLPPQAETFAHSCTRTL